MDFLSAFLLLLFLMDPFGNLALCQSLLNRVPPERRRRVLLRELVFALLILSGFFFVGESMMKALGLRQPAINVAGGVVLFLIALNMVFPTPGRTSHDSPEEPFIVPLAMPLIAGPSTLAALLLLVSKHPGRQLEWLAALTTAWLVQALILLSGGWILGKLGQKGTQALEKLTGMLLIMIAVQMLLDGIATAIREG